MPTEQNSGDLPESSVFVVRDIAGGLKAFFGAAVLRFAVLAVHQSGCLMLPTFAGQVGAP